MAAYPHDASNLPSAPPIRLSPIEDARPSLLLVWLAIIAIGFILLDFLFVPVTLASIPPGAGAVPPTDVRFYLVCFGLGAIAAEPGLLAIAAVFGPGIAWRRHLVVAFLVLMLVLSGVVGIFSAERIHAVSMFYGRLNWPFTLLVPFLFCDCQLPLWIFRSLFCWRISKERQGDPERAPRLSIMGILAATAVIALSLAAVRLLPFLFQQIQPNAKVEVQVLWLLTGMWAIVLSAISLAVLPMFAAAIFRMRSPFLGVMGAAAWSALIFVATITITRMVYGGWPLPISWHLPATIVLGFTVGLVVPLLVVRLHGYRLLWGKGG